MADKAKFKVVVKDGSSYTKYNSATSRYDEIHEDYIYEANNFVDALYEFMTYVSDDYTEDKVQLVFIPAKYKKGKK